MKLSKRGLAFIKEFESFYPFVYDDKGKVIKGRYQEFTGGQVKGTLTIGYGHTTDAGMPKVVPGMRITEEEAAEILDRDLDKVESDVNRLVKVVISQHEYDALVSFHFNTGALGRSTLLRKLNAMDVRGAANEFLRWTRAKGQVLRGLVRRREAEKKIFLEGY